MRKLTWFAAGFGLACLLSCYQLGGIWAAVGAAVLLLGAGVLWLKCRPRRGEPSARELPAIRRAGYETGRRLMALCLGGVLAFGWFAGYAALFYEPAAVMADTEQSISATVISYPESTSVDGYSVTLRLDGDFRAPHMLLYGSGEWGDLKPGDRVRCTARLKRSDRLYGDETTYYTAKGVYLLAYCDDPPAVTRANVVPLRYWPALCARELKQGIFAAFDGVAAPLAAAVTLGDKSELDEQLYSALSRSGVMHAAVVSGMHISFLVSVLMILCRGNRKVALGLIPLLLFYALMAGGTPSAIRAVIMQVALLAGPVLGRETDPPSSLGLALLVLLIQNPFAAASVSLQLSFGAVAGILLITGPLNEAMLRPAVKVLKKGRLRWLLRGYRFIAAAVAASLGAMLLTTPVTALYFGRISIAAPLANVLVLWAMTALMVAALVIGALAVLLPGVMVCPAMVFGLLGHYVRAVVMEVGSWPLAALPVVFPAFLIWLALVYLQIPACVFARRRWRQAGLSLLCLALLLGGAVAVNGYGVRRSDLTVAALDVGQGASTLFLSGDRAILVDCGGNGQDSAGDTAADYLAAIGRNRLDLLVLTHMDDDHFNGVAQLLCRLEVTSIAAPEGERLDEVRALARQEGAALIVVEQKHTVSLGSGTMTLYPPLGSGTSNESGLFALCSVGGFDALVTGDADSFVERMLIKYYDLPDLELLLAGHHGSKYSTGQELLDRLRPELAVISVGYNAYGHPAPETLARLEAAGAKIYRTDENGTVTISLKDGMIAVK